MPVVPLSAQLCLALSPCAAPPPPLARTPLARTPSSQNPSPNPRHHKPCKPAAPGPLPAPPRPPTPTLPPPVLSPSQVERKAVAGLLLLVGKDRQGEAVDRGLLKGILRMFSALARCAFRPSLPAPSDQTNTEHPIPACSRRRARPTDPIPPLPNAPAPAAAAAGGLRGGV